MWCLKNIINMAMQWQRCIGHCYTHHTGDGKTLDPTARRNRPRIYPIAHHHIVRSFPPDNDVCMDMVDKRAVRDDTIYQSH